MNLLARLTLLAYPRSFRREFGADYLQMVTDLRTYSGYGRIRVATRLVGESLTTALTMRWENVMPTTRSILMLTAAVAALVGLIMGSEAIAVLVVAAVVLAALGFAGKDRPIAPSDPSVTRRWYWWLAGAAGAFLLGLATLAITEKDGGLSEAAWAAWMLSWAVAAILALVGAGLGAARLISHRH